MRLRVLQLRQMQGEEQLLEAGRHLLLLRCGQRCLCTGVCVMRCCLGGAAGAAGLWLAGRKRGEMMAGAAVLLEFEYGSPGAVDRDVDAFERFYRVRFGEQALKSLTERVRRQSLACGVSLCAAMGLLCVPMLINASSIFALILLLMGLGLGGLGVFFLIRAARAGAYCERNLDRLLDREFAATRSVTKRCFRVRCTEEGIGVEFGTRSSVKQKRFCPYGEISRICEDDGLLFIQGLTWMCREQMGEEPFEALTALLRERCPESWVP